MRSHGHVVLILLASLATTARGEAVTHNSGAQASNAQNGFELLKTLAGNWKGQASMAHDAAAETTAVRVSLRVTSGGAALMHEMTPGGRSNDPTRGDDDPITMIYVDGGRLLLTHYCDSGKNRPRMVGTLSPDAKTVDFRLLDVSGGTKLGHMHRAAFTFVDANHHTEDWIYMSPTNEEGHAHIELVRAP